MKIKHVQSEIFAEVEQLLAAEQYDAAWQQLEAIHIEHHDEAFVHLRIHVLQWRIARRQHNRRRQVGQILPIIFAVPVSYVQRYLGLALPSRMGKRGC
jgi:hypothetical protein